MILRQGFAKILILLLLLIGIGADCSELIPLRWEDFCPAGLENAQYKEVKWFWPEGTKSTQEIYNYWANRRKEFQDILHKCNSLNDASKVECYAELKQRQIFYNDQYKRDIHQQQITRQDWRDTYEKGSRAFMINIFQH